MKNGAFSRCSMKWMYSATSSSLWIGLSSSRNSSPLIRDSMSDSRKSMPSRRATSTSSASPMRVAVIVVDVLEIVDVEKGQREMAGRSSRRSSVVDAVLDHPPRRQAGQLVIIGRAEQLVLERLLLGDVGGTREQQLRPAIRTGRWAGEEYLLVRLAANASSSTAARPARSNSRQVSRRSSVAREPALPRPSAAGPRRRR